MNQFLTMGTFSMFRHGPNVHERSVVYGPANDILVREEISSTSESERDDWRRISLLQPVTPPNIDGTRPTFRKRLGDQQEEGTFLERPLHRKKAGARRRRRFLNDYFIEEQLAQHLANSPEEAKQEWYSLFVQSRDCAFRQLVEDEAAMAAFEPFLEISMEKQKKKLYGKPRAEAPREKAISTDPEVRFDSIPGELQLVLWRCAANDSLSSIQDTITEYVTSMNEDALELTLQGLPRVMCHAIAAYYGLTSRSEMVGSDRVTFVTKVGGVSPPLPDLSLTEYLANASERCHACDNRQRRHGTVASRYRKRRPRTAA